MTFLSTPSQPTPLSILLTGSRNLLTMKLTFFPLWPSIAPFIHKCSLYSNVKICETLMLPWKKRLWTPHPRNPKITRWITLKNISSTEAAHYHIWVAQSTWHQTGNHTWSCFTNSQWGSRQSNMRGVREVKFHWFAWRANQWPLVGETLFSSVPPSNSLVSISDP